MFRPHQHCPYKYRWQLVEWAKNKWPDMNVKKKSTKQLYAMYYSVK